MHAHACKHAYIHACMINREFGETSTDSGTLTGGDEYSAVCLMREFRKYVRWATNNKNIAQESPRETRRAQESSGESRRVQETPGESRRAQESQESPENPGEPRRAQESPSQPGQS